MAYYTGLKFNTIYVLESLAPGERRTGLELRDAVIFPGAVANEGLFEEYHFVPDAKALAAALGMILNDARVHGRGPLLHIEAHGDENGLQLADGQYVPWREITPQLAAINEACRMNLLVMAGMCHGWNLTLSLMPAERAPVFALIGPPETMSAGDLEEATKRFYTALLTEFDINAGLEAMNEHRPFADWPIHPATAEILFCRVFRRYLADLANALELQERENKIVADVVRARRLDVLQSAQLRQEVRRQLNDRAWWYSHLRHTFLMLDLFPENATRFGLSYDQCMNSAA